MSAHAQAHAESPAAAPSRTAPARLLQRKCACGGAAGLSEECESCGRNKLTLQRRAAGPAEPSVPPVVHDVLGTPGSPLDSSTRSFMETRFGHDFGHVRVHTDGRAAESANAVNALAYTVGRDIVFARGQYAPATAAGQRLLAHEMTHVLQQSAGGGGGGGGASRIQFAGRESDRYEAEADAVAERVTGHAPGPSAPAAFTRLAHAAPVSLMRQPAPPKTCDPPAGARPTQTEISQKLVDRMMGKYAAQDQDTGEGCIPTPYVAGIQEHVCTIGYGHQITKKEMDCPVLRKDTNQPLTDTEKKTKKFDPPWQLGGAQPGDAQPAPAESPAAQPPAAGKVATPPAVEPVVEERKEVQPAQAPAGPAGDEKKEGQKPSAPAPPKKGGGAKPSKPKDPNDITIDKLRCGCEGKWTVDCKGQEAAELLKKDAGKAVNWVRQNVPVTLDDDQFDALVDMTLHVGSIPGDLLDAIKKYWCTNRGKNYVRELYLKTALTRQHSSKVEPNFVHRREVRVWPPLPEEPEPPAAPEKKAAPPPKKAEEKPKPQTARPPTLVPELEPQPAAPSLLPGAPAPGPVQKAAQEVEYARGWARRLQTRGESLRGRLGSGNRPSETELKAFGGEVAQWRAAVQSNIERYRREGRGEAAGALGELLDRVGPALQELRVHLGVEK